MLFTEIDVQEARDFAHAQFEVHGIKRKYTGEDYITHCDEIVSILAQYGLAKAHTRVLVYLHDVVEDTTVTSHHIVMGWGHFMGCAVDIITDPDKPENETRSNHKKLIASRLINAPTWLRNAKAGDLISNMRSIRKHDLGFAVVFVKEARYLAEHFGNIDQGLKNELLDEISLTEQAVTTWCQKRDTEKLIKYEKTPTDIGTAVGNIDFLLSSVEREMTDACHAKAHKVYGINGNIFAKTWAATFIPSEVFIQRLIYRAINIILKHQGWVIDLDSLDIKVSDITYQRSISGTDHKTPNVFVANLGIYAPTAVMLPLLETPVWKTDCHDPHWSYVSRNSADRDQFITDLLELI